MNFHGILEINFLPWLRKMLWLVDVASIAVLDPLKWVVRPSSLYVIKKKVRFQLCWPQILYCYAKHVCA